MNTAADLLASVDDAGWEAFLARYGAQSLGFPRNWDYHSIARSARMRRRLVVLLSDQLDTASLDRNVRYYLSATQMQRRRLRLVAGMLPNIAALRTAIGAPILTELSHILGRDVLRQILILPGNARPSLVGTLPQALDDLEHLGCGSELAWRNTRSPAEQMMLAMVPLHPCQSQAGSAALFDIALGREVAGHAGD